jgi:inorganic pyrophosphatase
MNTLQSKTELELFYENRFDLSKTLNEELVGLFGRGSFCKTLGEVYSVEYEVEIARGNVQKWERTIDGRLILDRISHIPYPVNYGYLWESPAVLMQKGLEQYEDTIILDLESLKSRLNYRKVQGVALRTGIVVGVITMIDKGEVDDKYIVIPGVDCMNHEITVSDILSIDLQIRNYINFLTVYKVKTMNMLSKIVSDPVKLDYSDVVQVTSVRLF